MPETLTLRPDWPIKVANALFVKIAYPMRGRRPLLNSFRTGSNDLNRGADRCSEDVLAYCQANGIGLVPCYPLAAGRLTQPGSILSRLAAQKSVSASQVVLTWTLKRSPVLLPIPVTSEVAHLEENGAAAGVELTDKEFLQLDDAGRRV
ncbi:aldo/keto reductase [Rhizobium straminoryzae]|nr:aldo/keto reductase [Rhizobium straminoryzae]